MTFDEMKGVAEGILFVAGDEGVDLTQLSEVLQVSELVASEIIENLKEEYDDHTRGLSIVEVAGVYQLTTKKAHSHFYKRLVESPTSTSLSQAALETLAIICYRQPITRAEIEEIRGVKTERPIQSLVSRVLIKEVGRAEGTGRAILYGTTKEFLEYFGLRSLKELPPLPEFIEENSVQDEADLFFEKLQETFDD